MKRRQTVLLLAVAMLLAAVPVPAVAADPATGSVTTASGRVLPPLPTELQQPSVHAQMLADEGAQPMSFQPGSTPIPLAAGTTSSAGTFAYQPGVLPNALQKEVFGFLPYWMLTPDALADMRYDLVSTVAYFGVGTDVNGHLVKGSASKPSTGWAGWTSDEMTGVIDAAHAHGGKVVLTVTMMGWDSTSLANMGTFLGDAGARAQLVSEIVSAVQLRNADGVSLDFEPVATSQRANFTSFVKQVKQGLTAAGVGNYVTVCVMAGAATWATGYDVAGLTAVGGADHLFVMGYDYFWSGSSRAGGVAPISSPYTLDVATSMDDFLAETTPDKLIWGVPYYGRTWPTTSGDLNATTLGSGSKSYYYTGHLAQAAQYGRLWDSVGQVPWYRYQDGSGQWVEGYYDDVTSLSAKYALIKQHDLAGTGMWTLLMDGGRNELWNLLADTFAPPFDDIGSSPFRRDIGWLASSGITKGCSETSFCPTASVTREQMASFLARALDLPPATTDYFTDDGGSIHEGDINRLAAAGVTTGCGNAMFCPKATVTRDQMASFLVRARKFTAGAGINYFDDDNGSPHETDIDRLAYAAVTSGCATRRYCPSGTVTREQMAAFLHRAFGG